MLKVRVGDSSYSDQGSTSLEGFLGRKRALIRAVYIQLKMCLKLQISKLPPLP